MSYVKQNFQSGAKLYASQLNSMDNQIAQNESDIMQTKEDLSQLGDELDLVASITKNEFDKSMVVRGEYWEGKRQQVGAPVTNTAFSYCVVDVKPNTDYICSAVSYKLYMVDANGIILDIVGTVSGDLRNYILTTVNNCTKLIISWKHAVVSADDYMVVCGNVMPNYYISYNNPKVSIKDTVTIPKEKEYHVGIGQQYETFTSCIRALNGDSTPKKVIVHSGIYDIFDEIGGKAFADTVTSSADWANYADFIPENTHVIGLGYVLFRFAPEKDTDISKVAAATLSAIHTQKTCTIENINIYCKNCRYGIHDDTQNGNYHAIKKFINCNVFHDVYDGYGYTQAYAGGMSYNQEIEFENCTFTGYSTYVWSIHTGAGSSDVSGRIKFNNCKFVSPVNYRRPIRLGNTNIYGQHIVVDMNNCYLSGTNGISVQDETTDTRVKQAFDITMLNCTSCTPEMIASNNTFGIKQYNSI